MLLNFVFLENMDSRVMHLVLVCLCFVSLLCSFELLNIKHFDNKHSQFKQFTQPAGHTLSSDDQTLSYAPGLGVLVFCEPVVKFSAPEHKTL